MRKAFPERDAKQHDGWRVTPQEKLQGDAAGKKLAASAKKHWERISGDYPGTPWEELAKRDRATPLGLDWQAAKLRSNP